MISRAWFAPAILTSACSAPLQLGVAADGGADADASSVDAVLDSAIACEQTCSSGVCRNGVCCSRGCDGICYPANYRTITAAGGDEVLGAHLRDVNGDGFDDAIFTTQSSVESLVYLGNAAGELVDGIRLVTTRSGISVAVGDVDEDGFADMLFAVQGMGPPYADRIRILFGSATSPFARFTDLMQTENPGQLELIDVNRDAHLDLVARMQSAGYTALMLGHGDGTFGSATRLLDHAAIGDSESIRRADFDGDGVYELVEHRDNEIPVRVHYFDATGSIVREDQLHTFDGAAIYTLDVTDLDRDGKDDLVVFRPDYAEWSARASRGNALIQTCTAAEDIRATDAFNREHIQGAGDFNGDGLLDFTGRSTCTECSSNVYLHLGVGDGE